MVRRALREAVHEGRLLERMAEDLLGLFQGLGLPGEEDLGAVEEDPTRPGGLWDLEGGVAYGGDDPGEGPEES